MRFADEELERPRFEPEADPLPDAEFEVKGKVPAFAGAPQARKFAQEPAVVDYLQRRQTCAFNQRRNVFTEQLFGLGRPRAIQGVSAPARISPRTRSTSGLRVTGLSRLSILSIQPLLCRLCRRFVYLRLLAIQGLIRLGMTNVEIRMTNQVPREAIPNAR